MFKTFIILLFSLFLSSQAMAQPSQEVSPAARRIVEIVRATYGYQGKVIDRKKQAEKECLGKPFCSIFVVDAASMGGDPSPGDPKVYSVLFKCSFRGHSETFHAFAFEGFTFFMACP